MVAATSQTATPSVSYKGRWQHIRQNNVLHVVSVDTGTFSVYQYRSILEHFRVPYQSILVHSLCTIVLVDIGMFNVYQYRSVLEHLSCTI